VRERECALGGVGIKQIAPCLMIGDTGDEGLVWDERLVPDKGLSIEIARATVRHMS